MRDLRRATRQFALVQAALLCAILAACRAPTQIPGHAPGSRPAWAPAALGGTSPPTDLRGGILPPALPDAPAGTGLLRLRVRWPDRDGPGFRAAVIPLSTSALVVAVRDGASTVGRAVLMRQPGVATVTADLPIKAANNLTVEVKAYREADPDAEGTVPIASGTAAGVSIVPSRTTDIAIHLASLHAPDITGLSPNPARGGDTVVLSGRNFLGVPGSTPSVTIGAAEAAVVQVLPDALSILVPAGAYTGRVGVTVDGVAAASAATLWVASGLAIDAPKATWDPTGSDARAVIVERSLQFAATFDWRLAPGESTATYGTPPAATWQVEAGTAGAIDARGVFTAAATPGTGRVHALAGSLKSGSVAIKALDVVGFSLTPGSGTLGPAGDPVVHFAGINTFSDGSTGSAATFVSSDPASVSIGEDGEAVVADGRTYGTATITATSALESGLAATASVVQTAYRVETIAGGTAGNQDGTGSAARFQYPAHVALDGSTALYVADVGNGRVRRIDLGTLAVTTPLASLSPITAGYGVALTADHVYTTGGNRIHQAARSLLLPLVTFAGASAADFLDGTGTAARFANPYGLAPDGAGNLYVAEFTNAAVRRIAIATREVTTVAGGGTQGSIDGTGSAARFHYPVAVAADGAGSLYVADYGENVYPNPKGGKIRRIDLATGAVSTLAGSGLYASIDGQGAAAAFNTPDALAVDAAGNVYVAEQNGSRIRRVTPRGLVTTIAGSGALSSTDGIGTGASFHQPWGIAVTLDGRVLYVADMATHKIRKLAQLP